MICIISGFQTRISALQFEHSWQHPYQTRHIEPSKRITPKKTSARGINKYIGNLRLLANAPAFKKLPLKVHLFEKSAADTWERNKFNIETNVQVEYDLRIEKDEPIGGGTSLTFLKSTTRKSTKDKDEYLSKSIELIDNTTNNNSTTDLIAVCPHCYYTTELTTLAKHFTKNTNDLIPTDGECLECNESINWHQIASNARRIRQLDPSSLNISGSGG